MRAPRIRLSLLSLLIASSASAVTMDWTPVGDPGNACEVQNGGCFGSVGYAYNIGTYDVTNAQYAEFLNAKAKSDPLALYNTNMGDPSMSNTGFGGITRSGSDGSYAYSAIAARENMPVNWVSFSDALRFANWMNNGQGSGDTETGAYNLLGGPVFATRNAGATIVLTSEDEWYKAAYYNAITTSYFTYPTSSSTPPTCSVPTGVANHANCNNAVGDLTPVGSYAGSASPYGTFDQGGNVGQWTEGTTASFGSRVIRGGDFQSGASVGSDYLASNWRVARYYSDEERWYGFRLAMVPEPGTGLLVFAGLLGLAAWRRARA